MLLDLLGVKGKMKKKIKSYISVKTDQLIVKKYVHAPICNDEIQSLANGTIDTVTGVTVDAVCVALPL